MAVPAGSKARGSDLSWDVGGTALTDDTNSGTGSYEQWGTETIVFSDPGVPVKVVAHLTGQRLNTSDADTNGAVRVGISIDGGTTWSYGNTPSTNVGTSVGTRQPCAASNYVSGDPTGSIVVRAEMNVSDTSISAVAGYLTATMIPNPA